MSSDHGNPALSSTTIVHILVDDSEPVGLHNDFLMGLGADSEAAGQSGGAGPMARLFGVDMDRLVMICVVIGISLVCFSILVATAIFFRRLRCLVGREINARRHHRPMHQPRKTTPCTKPEDNGYAQDHTNHKSFVDGGYKISEYGLYYKDYCFSI